MIDSLIPYPIDPKAPIPLFPTNRTVLNSSNNSHSSHTSDSSNSSVIPYSLLTPQKVLLVLQAKFFCSDGQLLYTSDSQSSTFASQVQ